MKPSPKMDIPRSHVKAVVLALPVLAGGPVLLAQEDLFTKDLFSNMRGPKIVVAEDGTILAFAKGCTLLRRSEDKGGTWTEQKEVNPGGGGNAVVDAGTGDVLIVCPNTSSLLRSKDNGKTWKKEDVTFKANLGGHGTLDTVRVHVGAKACHPLPRALLRF